MAECCKPWLVYNFAVDPPRVFRRHEWFCRRQILLDVPVEDTPAGGQQ